MVCELLTCMTHSTRHNLLDPCLWGLGEEPKGQISLNVNKKLNFKDFLTGLCASSHKCVMPRGLGLGGAGGKKKCLSQCGISN